MKASLTFTLPEERIEHLQAVHAGDAWAAIHELDCMMRNLIKHGDPRFGTPEELAHHVREVLGPVSQCLE